MHVFNVKGMSCGHCVRAVTQAIQARDAAAQVQVDLADGEVRVDSRLPEEALLEAIRGGGYEAAPA